MEETPRPVVMPSDKDGSLEGVRARMIGLLPRLRRFAVALTGTVADGDDLVQDTVERALRNLHQWETGTSLESWMFRIAKNRFIDNRRSAKRKAAVITEVSDTDLEKVAVDAPKAIEDKLTLKALAGALQSLPIEQREVVALVLINGASYREAADTLGIPIGTLTSRIARARESLAAALESSTWR
jgi:RNA polymerase sigma-70 factor (ECF subfamily)